VTKKSKTHSKGRKISKKYKGESQTKGRTENKRRLWDKRRRVKGKGGDGGKRKVPFGKNGGSSGLGRGRRVQRTGNRPGERRGK